MHHAVLRVFRLRGKLTALNLVTVIQYVKMYIKTVALVNTKNTFLVFLIKTDYLF